MVGCRRVHSRRLVRVLGTAAAATAAVLCLSARVAPPVLGVQASFDSADHRPTGTPTPLATPTPAPTARPTPTLTPMPTPMPTRPPEASPRPTAHPAPAQPTAAPVVASPPSAIPTPPPSTPPPSLPAPAQALPSPHPTPSLVTQLSAIPAAVAQYADDGHGRTSPYVVGADAMAGVAVTSSLALAALRRRGLL